MELLLVLDCRFDLEIDTDFIIRKISQEKYS